MPEQPKQKRDFRADVKKAVGGLYGQKPVKSYHYEEKKEKRGPPRFVKVTYSLAKIFKSFGRGAKFTPEQADMFGFLGWDVTAEQFYAAYKGLFMGGIAIGAVLASLVYLLVPIDEMLKMGLAGVFLLLPIGASYFYLKYPHGAVEREKMLALAYIPEIVNYLTMSMRLTPNLEKAVQFAANHGRGKIAEDMKKIVWDVQIGRYASIEEGLDELAYKWGGYNEEFKHALMLIRASLLEGNKERREELLEKAGDDVLEGTKEKMDMYARKLHQPTVYLYYFGILLPLLLAIILPIGGSMSGMPLAKAEYMFVAYNLLIPLIVYMFGSNIVAGKPPTYVPPDIPPDFPGLPPRGIAKVFGIGMPFRVFALLIITGFIGIGYMTDQGVTQDAINSVVMPVNNFLTDSFGMPIVGQEGIVIPGTLGQIPDYAVFDEEVKKLPRLTMFDNVEFLGGTHSFFIGQFTIFGFLLGVAISVSVYLLGEYSERLRVQTEIRNMESEFKDAMYVLASRMGENKPIEEALRSAVVFLPKSRIAKDVFKRILENITTMGMTLDAAIFDETFGALKNLPSRTIRSGMQFMVDSVELGVNVAAKSLISLSLQLRNAQKIDESLRKLLEDVTTMLSTMSTFVAPIVLAVVSAMQRLIMNSMMGSTATETAEQSVSSAGVQGFGGMTNIFSNKEALENSADPATFVLIMGIYVIEVVTLLTYFNSQIEDTGNKLHTYVSIGKSLPIAVALYCVVVYFASSSLGVS
ncbi:hypothetical protein COU36_03020 [Candidatus Micrarchaeota archaeon CG10_big_fil_rev_8_21_14_0_10_59_7]|nr:MAG: hypothetical protein COU36_03020 [Candidatus Micrarchaeota archaeon CG10_big_fil_rev_8_21_14_0_10_59_7]